MKLNKKLASVVIAGSIVASNIPYNVFADGANVVTIGVNLSDTQKEKVFEYFGTDADSVEVIEVTNDDERKYLEGIASESQLGKKTYSCAFVEPTEEGSGVNVKTANLTYVTSAMIASTLVTSGVENANVIAMSPMKVSGTGALTGIMMAYEQSSGEELDEEKKELASEELITTGDLSNEVGQDKATGIINDIKTEIIKNNTQDTNQIAETINNVVNNYNVTLNVGQIEAIQSLMGKIAKQDYNYNAIKGTLDTVTENVDKGLEAVGESVKRGTFFENLFKGVKDFFGNMFSSKEEDKNLGILEGTNDSILGENAVIDATDDSVVDVEAIKEEAKGFFAKIIDWFKGLFGGKQEVTEDVATPEIDKVIEEDVVDELEEGVGEESLPELDDDVTVENVDGIEEDTVEEEGSEEVTDEVSDSVEEGTVTDEEVIVE